MVESIFKQRYIPCLKQNSMLVSNEVFYKWPDIFCDVFHQTKKNSFQMEIRGGFLYNDPLFNLNFSFLLRTFLNKTRSIFYLLSLLRMSTYKVRQKMFVNFEYVKFCSVGFFLWLKLFMIFFDDRIERLSKRFSQLYRSKLSNFSLFSRCRSRNRLSYLRKTSSNFETTAETSEHPLIYDDANINFSNNGANLMRAHGRLAVAHVNSYQLETSTVRNNPFHHERIIQVVLRYSDKFF